MKQQTKYSSLAQSVEHLTVNQGVVGSSPTGGAIMGQQFCTPTQKSLISRAFRVFRGKKHHPFTIAPFLEPFGLEPATLWEYIEFILFLWYNLFDVIRCIGQIISQNDEKYIV